MGRTWRSKWKRLLSAVWAVTAFVVAGSMTVAAFGQAFDLGAHDLTGKSYFPAGKSACIACHDGPTWNHALSPTTGYTVSTTTISKLGDPNGVSAQCLGCHEGTGGAAIDDFVGATSNPPADFMGGNDAFGTDLTHHHPVSFIFDAALKLAHGGLLDPPSALLHDGGQVQCISCHDQHRIGDGNHGLGATTVLPNLCFQCHDESAHGPGLHHIPDRDHPWADFRCTECHGQTLAGAVFDRNGDGDTADAGETVPACTACHQPFQSPDPPPTGHHGGDRFDPIVIAGKPGSGSGECWECHGADLKGGSFDLGGGTTFYTPSCYRSQRAGTNNPFGCHEDLWSAGANARPVVAPLGPFTVNDGDTLNLTATATDADNDPLRYQWIFGDGTPPQFPSTSNTTSHVYTGVGTYTGILSVSDGVNDPVLVEFEVTVVAPPPPTAGEVWDVSTPASTFTVTFDTQAGALVVIKDDGTFGFGVEAGGVIFWLEMILDLPNASWSVGDTYFGNISRSGNTGQMSGVVFSTSLGVGNFSGIKR